MAVTPPAFMTPHSIGGRGMAARVVREALDAVASPTVVTRVLHRAMHMARVSAIPEEGVELRRFVAHPLDDSRALVHPFTEQAALRRNLLVAGCAPLLGLLAQRVNARCNDARLAWIRASSSEK